eukprot:TRINITY_DN9028_c0_g1_i1.p1 TRINITY_DN9028_c0_g1~~TRINITY_DN9028_c0_g1_i1.p1  ORF type:complete len:180 (+),score=80.16 TRINITY_DN9028_c0_g1_i1:52-591(+)
MSQSGKVTSWRGPFGFAEMEDGTSIYIHTDEIDGGRLRVGLTVNFDVEEGKEGKKKGTNVSGDAVVKKGVELSEEEKEADKARRQEMRGQRAETLKAEYQPVYDKVVALKNFQQVALLKKLVKELDGTIEQKRADPTQKKGGKKFTKGEFVAFYGAKEGSAMWEAAGSKKKAKKTITKE